MQESLWDQNRLASMSVHYLYQGTTVNRIYRLFDIQNGKQQRNPSPDDLEINLEEQLQERGRSKKFEM